MHDAGVTILAGTDSFDTFVAGLLASSRAGAAGRGGLLHDVGAAGRNARSGPLLRQEKERGTIDKGKIADMLLLDADPLADIRNARRIAAFVKAGDLLTRADLAAMLPSR
jgi:imidazolonepropionase-like amidohydrolase